MQAAVLQRCSPFHEAWTLLRHHWDPSSQLALCDGILPSAPAEPSCALDSPGRHPNIHILAQQRDSALAVVLGRWRMADPSVLLSCPYNLQNLALPEGGGGGIIWMFYCYCKAVTSSPHSPFRGKKKKKPCLICHLANDS